MEREGWRSLRDRKGKAKVFWFPNECKNGDFYQL
jgi:hypothetical protein